MLEAINLCKIYRPKHGVPVTALNRVSLRFPDKGMVFLLGRSGSGKSTLLNVLGGLDRYDDGEILIKGVSSRAFSQSDFDSYRNTYVGFIFQEYNILDEFDVGANIALALQLQGKKADDDSINRILHEVDLDGFGKRKPNELSGGQKQRVAIARALVKSPEIIMADEPTGALDSATGTQVFNTLKRLSAEKLVIVVSHDRDFAEQYADRIIELSDGRVISDVTKDNSFVPEPEGLVQEGDTFTVVGGYHLTEEDRVRINEYVDAVNRGVKITAKRRNLFRFIDTNPRAVYQAGGAFLPIKSKLPLKYAFPMGASGLKHKKIRLVFTILLSCVAFTLFGLADTFGSYNHERANVRSIIDSGITYATMEKTKYVEDRDYYRRGYRFSEQDKRALSEKTGVPLNGVWTPRYAPVNFSSRLGARQDNTPYTLQIDSFSGLVEVTPQMIEQMGYSVTGTLPVKDDEIAVSDLVYYTFSILGWRNDADETEKINRPEDFLGKKLPLLNKEYTVTGIVNTNFDRERYEKYLSLDSDTASTSDLILAYAMQTELQAAVNYSLVGLAMAAPNTLRALAEEENKILRPEDGYLWFRLNMGENNDGFSMDFAVDLSLLGAAQIHWLDGKERTSLGEKELVLSTNILQNLYFGNIKGVGDYSEISYLSPEDYGKLTQISITAEYQSYYGESRTVEGLKIVGWFDSETLDNENLRYSTIVCSGSAVSSLIQGDPDALYTMLMGEMPDSESGVRRVVQTALEPDGEWMYPLQNPVSFELETVNEVLNVLSKVFLWIGVGFALFASLLLSNFIAVSITYKKQEIGILRAIGSRGNDVFRIFFSESFLIAAINFVLSSIATGAIVAIVNHVIRREGVLITILNFGFRQIGLLILISVGIAALASFLPVRKIAAKRPIDAIRDR